MNEEDYGSELENIDYRALSHIVQRHTIGLIKLFDLQNPGQKYLHIGAGTFVTIGRNRGILTARHCIDSLDNNSALGLTISQNWSIFKIYYPRSRIVNLGNPVNDEMGPDLAFINLTPTEVASISVEFNFINLNTSIEKMEKINICDPSYGWAICGTPEVGTITNSDPIHYKADVSLQNYCLFINPPVYSVIDNKYDYWECHIDFLEDKNLPHSFGGMSGGGLWMINCNKDGEFSFFLAGVMFFQSAMIHNMRSIKCNGFKCINLLMQDVSTQYSNANNP